MEHISQSVLFQFNFVGRILGPRGLTAKQLEQETGCKVMVRGKGSMRDKKKVRFCYKITDIITELQFTMRAHRFVMFETIKTRSVVSNCAPAQHQARCGMVKKSPKEGRRGTSHLCWPPYCIISHGQHLASQPFPPDTTQYPHLRNVLSCCPTGQNTSQMY